ncbi:HAD-IIA family hydrolase [Stetteria hydrogenophila]
MALVDLDGVVWLGSRVIEENVEGLLRLHEAGVRLVYVTNNSTRPRAYYAWRLRRLGLPAGESSVVTSAVAAAAWVAARMPGALVYPLGEEGLVHELSAAGLVPVTLDAARRGEAQAVVVGLDRGVTYAKLDAAFRAVRAGAAFVAANEDPAMPVEDGLAPGAGALVAALERALGRRPDFVAGKPNPWMVEVARRQAGIPEGARMLVIGDRLNTDAEMARRAGLDSLIVATGVASLEEARGRATYAARNVLEALGEILGAGDPSPRPGLGERRS